MQATRDLRRAEGGGQREIAKEIVLARRAILRMHAQKAHLSSLSNALQIALVNHRIGTAFGKSAAIMVAMNRMLSVPQLSALAFDMSRVRVLPGPVSRLLSLSIACRSLRKRASSRRLSLEQVRRERKRMKRQRLTRHSCLGRGRRGRGGNRDSETFRRNCARGNVPSGNCPRSAQRDGRDAHTAPTFQYAWGLMGAVALFTTIGLFPGTTTNLRTLVCLLPMRGFWRCDLRGAAGTRRGHRPSPRTSLARRHAKRLQSTGSGLRSSDDRDVFMVAFALEKKIFVAPGK